VRVSGLATVGPHAKHVFSAQHHIAMCGLSVHSMSQTARFSENILRIKCIFICSTTFSEHFLILRRIQQGIITNVHRFSCKVPVILVTF
jgi:hypothetical protein